MRALLHMPLDPQSRLVRLVLAEKNLEARLIDTPPWRENPQLAAANPGRTIPVLIDDAASGDEIAVSPSAVIVDYLEDAYRGGALARATAAGRAETRRLVAWFNDKFEHDVNERVCRQRIDGRLRGLLRYDLDAYQAGLEALRWHLDYVSWLVEHRTWLGGEKMCAADLAGAAHLSVADYLGIIPWADFPVVKEWYQRLKCRPSFRALLADRVESLPPASHYDDLDF